jgi:hypothetical protein
MEVSEGCYEAIEEWLEDYYDTFPFKRIYEGGVTLGYKGFINNFKLEVEEVISGVIEVRVVYRPNGDIRHKQSFDMWKGTIQTDELQGYLL